MKACERVARIKPSERVLTTGRPREFLPWAFLILASQCSSVAQSCLALWDPMDCSCFLSITKSRSLLKLFPLTWWCHPTISSSVIPFSSCLQSLPASGAFPMSQFFASGGQSVGASASTSVLPMNKEIPGLISFRMDWFDPLAVQGTLKSLLQHHSSKASILQCSTFFTSFYCHLNSDRRIITFCFNNKDIAVTHGNPYT